MDAIPDAEEGAAAAVQYAATTAETPIPAAETPTPAAAEILITEMASMTVFQQATRAALTQELPTA